MSIDLLRLSDTYDMNLTLIIFSPAGGEGFWGTLNRLILNLAKNNNPYFVISIAWIVVRILAHFDIAASMSQCRREQECQHLQNLQEAQDVLQQAQDEQ